MSPCIDFVIAKSALDSDLLHGLPSRESRAQRKPSETTKRIEFCNQSGRYGVKINGIVSGVERVKIAPHKIFKSDRATKDESPRENRKGEINAG